MVVPFVLFSGGYGAYHGLLLMRLAFLDFCDYPYPIELTNAAVLKSAILSALGAVAIVLVWLLRADRVNLSPLSLTPVKSRYAFRTGVWFFFAAIVLYWIQIHQMGGFTAFISIDRVQRFQEMRDTVSVPYMSFALISTALMFVGSEGKRKPRCIAWLVFASWVALLGLQGERSSSLQMLLVMAGVLGTLHPDLFRLRKATVSGGAVLVLAALVFAQVRSLIPLYIQGAENTSALVQNALMLDPWEPFMPEKSEIAGSYFSVLDSVSVHRELLLGRSYLESLPTFLPRSVYPGTKPVDLADELAESAAHGDLYAVGWGFNPVAEAYRNFGTVGVPLVMAGWALLFLWLGRVQDRSLFGLLLSSVLMQEALTVNRNSFRAIYLASLFNLVVLLIAYKVLVLCSDNDKQSAV
jgi:hypothetical protein